MKTTKFAANIPIYLQVKDLLIQQIVTGVYPPGQKIPSVRELAEKLTTNPRTIQNALKELISAEVLKTRRGQGNFVTTDQALIERLKKQEIQAATEKFLNKLKPYLSLEEIIATLVEVDRQRGGQETWKKQD